MNIECAPANRKQLKNMKSIIGAIDASDSSTNKTSMSMSKNYPFTRAGRLFPNYLEHTDKLAYTEWIVE